MYKHVFFFLIQKWEERGDQCSNPSDEAPSHQSNIRYRGPMPNPSPPFDEYVTICATSVTNVTDNSSQRFRAKTSNSDRLGPFYFGIYVGLKHRPLGELKSITTGLPPWWCTNMFSKGSVKRSTKMINN